MNIIVWFCLTSDNCRVHVLQLYSNRYQIVEGMLDIIYEKVTVQCVFIVTYKATQ